MTRKSKRDKQLFEMMKVIKTPKFAMIVSTDGEEMALDRQGRIWKCQKVGQDEWGGSYSSGDALMKSESYDASAYNLNHIGTTVKSMNERLQTLESAWAASRSVPIDMLLFCPRCHVQHVDRPDLSKGWDNPPHKSHLCGSCQTIWRPADVPTNGVAQIESVGNADTWRVLAP